MFIIISGSGGMADAIAFECREQGVLQTMNGLMDPAPSGTVAIHVGSRERFLRTLHYCEEHHIPLIQAASAQEDLVPQNTAAMLVLAPNLAAPVLYTLHDIVPRFAKLRDLGMQPLLAETHQASKKDKPSATALWIAEELGIPREDVLAVRRGDAHASHRLTFAAPGLKIELSIEAEGRRMYAQGALVLAQTVLESPFKPGIHRAEQFFFPGS